MPFSFKNALLYGLAAFGGVKLVAPLLAKPDRVDPDDIVFELLDDGEWIVRDTRSGARLGGLVIDDDEGLGLALDYAPGGRFAKLIMEREYGLEKDLDAAKDVVVEYLRANDLLDES
jgi:hypothetical protein